MAGARATRERSPLSCFEGQFKFFFFSHHMRHIFITIVSEMFVVKVGHSEKCSLYLDAVPMGGIGKS